MINQVCHWILQRNCSICFLLVNEPIRLWMVVKVGWRKVWLPLSFRRPYMTDIPLHGNAWYTSRSTHWLDKFCHEQSSYFFIDYLCIVGIRLRHIALHGNAWYTCCFTHRLEKICHEQSSHFFVDYLCIVGIPLRNFVALVNIVASFRYLLCLQIPVQINPRECEYVLWWIPIKF